MTQPASHRSRSTTWKIWERRIGRDLDLQKKLARATLQAKIGVVGTRGVRSNPETPPKRWVAFSIRRVA